MRFTSEEDHKQMEMWYPAEGTVGKVIDVGECNALIQWPTGSTSKNDRWYASLGNLELTQAPYNEQKLKLLVVICCFSAFVLGFMAAYALLKH